MKTLRFAIIADPIERFHPEAETTFFIMDEMSRRGHEVWIMELGDLFFKEGEVYSHARRAQVEVKNKKFSYRIREAKTILLKKFDALFLRKDPPVNPNFLYHLSLLSLVENNVLCVNRPSSVHLANEKTYPLHFPGLSPPTLVSPSSRSLLQFIAEHRKVVAKPLDSAGGNGVVILHQGDADRKSLLEMMTGGYTQYIMLQKFIPEIKKGDKRVLLFGDQILGAFLRVPPKDDFRGNMHKGARWVKAAVNAREKQVIRQIAPILESMGLFFVGLDFIGPWVTEINSTSPMGIREINALDRTRCEAKIMDWVENRLLNALAT